MVRFTFAAFAFIPLAFSQNLPAFRWIHQVDGSGSDAFAGLGADSQGNAYIAGSTGSTAFPVKAAVQNHLASAGLYRIDGAGSAYAVLSLTSASSLAVDLQNPNVLYATAQGVLKRSTDGGATFSALPLPSSELADLVIDPSNDRILYSGTFDQGVLKSTDGGATWTAINNGLTAPQGQLLTTQSIWIDSTPSAPAAPPTLFAMVASRFVRSADGGASWQQAYAAIDVTNVAFDAANPGTLYATTLGASGAGALKSTDHGQTFAVLNIPTGFTSIVADPNRSGRLLAGCLDGIFESDDDGVTWAQKSTKALVSVPLAPDWANGFVYAVAMPSTVVRFSSDLQTVTPVGPPSVGYVNEIAVANGHAYVAVNGTRDVFVTKLDPSGNVVYSTYFGGSADDAATAMSVDAAGNVYVTGTTTSLDFPVTKGAFASTGASFLFKLNPDGSVAYSTYFAPSGTTPAAIALDSAGSAYLAGTSAGSLPVTAGAYQTSCSCPFIPTFFLTIFQDSGFVAKFDSAASSLVYSTYIGGTGSLGSIVNALALASDGSAYVGGTNGIYRLNSTGSALLASSPPMINAVAMSVGRDGSLYLAGPPGDTGHPFPSTAGAFESASAGPPGLPGQVGSLPDTAVAKMDPLLVNVVAATYFGTAFNSIRSMTLDSAGDVYIGGYTAPHGIPTRTPIQGGFATTTGFLAELTGDLSTLLFSSYFGDAEHFSVQGIAAEAGGSVAFGGPTGQADQYSVGPMNIYVNSMTLAPPPALRIDAVDNAASLLDGPVSAGETIVVRGAGFGSDAQLLIGGAAVPAISIGVNAITAVIPPSVPAGAAAFQVQSGGANSNAVLMPVSVASPGIFSADGSGYGQGYILNKDGTRNTLSNPASPGDRITIFATGVGPVSFTQGYAVTASPVNVSIDGLYANGVSATMGPAPGLPGSVFQITVTVPNPASLAANNPNLVSFRLPPLVGVVLQVAGASSQQGIAISIDP